MSARLVEKENTTRIIFLRWLIDKSKLTMSKEFQSQEINYPVRETLWYNIIERSQRIVLPCIVCIDCVVLLKFWFIYLKVTRRIDGESSLIQSDNGERFEARLWAVADRESFAYTLGLNY